jgi:hypothetical protein
MHVLWKRKAFGFTVLELFVLGDEPVAVEDAHPIHTFVDVEIVTDVSFGDGIAIGMQADVAFDTDAPLVQHIDFGDVKPTACASK